MNTMRYLIEKQPKGYEGWEDDYMVSLEGEIAKKVLGQLNNLTVQVA